ncbi:PD-(D/E)XK nuclease-like domain-containing protein [Microbacterium sp. LWH12-1.2]|uniref:PD-(D/E)XK nuclease-like domain-containing protein n=1 Tax=Microbacterium sp. LWH12-1.2 TaxID=3135259 RepID=UPI0034319E1E
MPDEIYHARPELSSTGARTLLPEFKGSPAKFIWEKSHPRTSRAFDIGHAVHAKVLGTGLQAVAYPEDLLASNGAASTKLAKDWAQEQRDNGFVPMKSVEVNVINKITEAVLANTDARKVLEQPHRETSIFSTSPEGVPVRARFDIYGNTAGADLKTTADASPRGFNHHVVEFGYFVQHAWYDDVHFFETGERLDSFSFIAVQTTGPYHVAVYPLDVMYLEIGRKLAREARDVYQRCVETNTWPGIEGELLAPPNWLVYEHEEQVTF